MIEFCLQEVSFFEMKMHKIKIKSFIYYQLVSICIHVGNVEIHFVENIFRMSKSTIYLHITKLE